MCIRALILFKTRSIFLILLVSCTSNTLEIALPTSANNFCHAMKLKKKTDPSHKYRKYLSLLITSNHFRVSVFSTHITHRGTGRRFHLSSLRHINHPRGGLRASCALVSRGSRYISLQVKCNQSVYRRTCAHAGGT